MKKVLIGIIIFSVLSLTALCTSAELNKSEHIKVSDNNFTFIWNETLDDIERNELEAAIKNALAQVNENDVSNVIIDESEIKENIINSIFKKSENTDITGISSSTDKHIASSKISGYIYLLCICRS